MRCSGSGEAVSELDKIPGLLASSRIAAAGKAGAGRALAILHQEIERTLDSWGVSSVDALGAYLLARGNHDRQTG